MNWCFKMTTRGLNVLNHLAVSRNLFYLYRSLGVGGNRWESGKKTVFHQVKRGSGLDPWKNVWRTFFNVCTGLKF